MKCIKTLLASLILVGCGGGGGSPSDDSVTSTTSVTRYGINFEAIENPLDIRVDFYDLLPSGGIDRGQLNVYFDLDESGTYGEGDVAVKIGNQSNSILFRYGGSWSDGGDYVVEYINGGTTYSFRRRGGVIVGGTNIYTQDIGGNSYTARFLEGNPLSVALILRTNYDFNSESNQSIADSLKASLREIDQDTPRYVEFSDKADPESADYIPAEGLFSTENSLILNDIDRDYTGTNERFDLKSVELIL